MFYRKDGDDKGRPVIIHRAILGSVERMIAILTENYSGKWWGGFVFGHTLENNLKKKWKNAMFVFYFILTWRFWSNVKGNVIIFTSLFSENCLFFRSVRPSTRPLWLSPRQVMLVPVNPSCEDYAKRVSLPLLCLDRILVWLYWSEFRYCMYDALWSMLFFTGV